MCVCERCVHDPVVATAIGGSWTQRYTRYQDDRRVWIFIHAFWRSLVALMEVGILTFSNMIVAIAHSESKFAKHMEEQDLEI